MPVVDGTAIVWTMDVVLGNGERVIVCKARRKTERKVWKQLSALHRFVLSTVPEVERVTFLTAPDQQGTDHDKKNPGAAR